MFDLTSYLIGTKQGGNGGNIIPFLLTINNACEEPIHVTLTYFDNDRQELSLDSQTILASSSLQVLSVPSFFIVEYPDSTPIYLASGWLANWQDTTDETYCYLGQMTSNTSTDLTITTTTPK